MECNSDHSKFSFCDLQHFILDSFMESQLEQTKTNSSHSKPQLAITSLRLLENMKSHYVQCRAVIGEFQSKIKKLKFLCISCVLSVFMYEANTVTLNTLNRYKT